MIYPWSSLRKKHNLSIANPHTCRGSWFYLHRIIESCLTIYWSRAFNRITLVVIWCLFISTVFTTLIMHQYSTIRNIIGMKVLNLKVIDCYRAFQQFMLSLLNNDILAVYCLSSYKFLFAIIHY